MIQEAKRLCEAFTVRKQLDCAFQGSDTDKEHAESQNDLTDVPGYGFSGEKCHDRPHKQDERRIAGKVKGGDLGCDRGTDIRPHDDADRL